MMQPWYQRLYSQCVRRKSVVSTVTILLLIPILIACPGGGGNTPENRAPTVTLSVTPSGGTVPLNVEATATATDPDGDTLSFSWRVNGEAVTGSDSTLSTTLEPAGSYTIRVTVSDGSLQASAEQTVTVTAPSTEPTDTVVGGFVSEQSRNVIVILTSDDEDDEASVPALKVDDINQAASRLMTQKLADGKLASQATQEPVIRGVNALVMHSIFSQQQEGGRTLFNFEGKEVVAANSRGEVLSSGTIGQDGRFDVALSPEDKQEPLAFFVAEQNEDGSWRCIEQLEYDIGTATEPALINLVDSQAEDITLGSAFVPAATSTNLVAGVTSAPSEVRVPADSDTAQAFRDGVYRACANPNWRETTVTAEFSWGGEIFSGAVDLDNDGFIDFAGFDESILYDNSLGFGLFLPDSVDTAQDPSTGLDNITEFYSTLEASEVRGIGPISSNGEMVMEVIKEAGQDIELSLTLMDIGFFFPPVPGALYTPVFDLNDALRFGNPSDFGENTIVDDDGFAYGRGGGAMAYRAGAVAYPDPETRELLPATDALVVIALQREDILAFNYTYVDEDGFYQLLIPSIGIGADNTIPPYFFGVFDFERNLWSFVANDFTSLINLNYFVTDGDARIENFLLELPLN